MAYRVADTEEQTLDRESPERREHDRVLKQVVAWFEESEQSSQTSREKAERDRDYYDGKQWTEEEAAELRRRGQPVIALNVIRARVNYHLGMEKKQRRDPKAFGRGPEDQQAAEVATEALRYAMERTDYHSERSRVWENVKIEGNGALEPSLVPRPDGNYDIAWKQVPWDRFFADPHSARGDYSDARYVGQVKWMDEEEVLEAYPDGGVAVDAALAGATDVGIGLGTTYEDRPRWQMWADPRRKRIRVVQIWYIEHGQWIWCEFCKGGVLASGPSPWEDDEGDSLCGLLAESCYVDRENNRYGEVRDLVDPQDEVNKRRSKALHAVNTNLVITESGAIPDGDIEKARREANRPDGLIVVQGRGARFEIDRNTELAQGQAVLLQQAMAHVMSTGPNAALLGKGTEDQSGRAIQAQQQGGLIELGDGLDVLRRLDHRVYKFTWWAIRKYWQAPMWIRISEDPEAPSYLGINQMEMGPMGQPQMNNRLAEADVDIILEDAPDVPTLEGETFAAVMDVLSKGAPPPMMKVMLELHPGLKPSVKKRMNTFIDEMMQQASQAQQMQMQLEGAKAQADAQKSQVEAQDKMAKSALERERFEFEKATFGAGEQQKAQLEAEKMQLEREKMQLEREQTSIESEIKRAELAIKIKELDVKLRELEMRGVEAERGAQEREATRQEASQRQNQPPPAPDRSGEAIGKGLEALAQAMSRPKRVVRGADGRPEGIE